MYYVFYTNLITVLYSLFHMKHIRTYYVLKFTCIHSKIVAMGSVDSFKLKHYNLKSNCTYTYPDKLGTGVS